MLKNVVVRAFAINIVSKRCAGHSKWANIKHIKAEKDGERSKLFVKLVQRIKVAIQEGGSANPMTNAQLGQAVDSAKRSNMPIASIENAIKSAQIDKSKAASVWFEVKGPKGCMIIVSAFTENPKRTKEGLSSIVRRNNGVWAEGGRHLFEGKGVIEAKAESVTSGEAEEHAIEAGAEDIYHDKEQNAFKFICAMEEVNGVVRKLEGFGYEILEAEVSFLPRTTVELDQPDLDLANKLIDKLTQHPDVLRTFSNIV